MSSLGQRTINQALADARGLGFLNAIGDTADYTNANLLSVAVFVIGEIEDEFAKCGLKPKEKIDATNFIYTANALSIPIPVAITDFRHPMEMWESDTGEKRWTPMFRANALPAPPQAAPQFLSQWEWSEDTIKVNACTRARDILIRYRRQLAYPADGAGIFPGGEDYYWALVAGVAYYAAGATVRTDLDIGRLEGIYRKRLTDAILVEGRDAQVINIRQQSAKYTARTPWWVVSQ